MLYTLTALKKKLTEIIGVTGADAIDPGKRSAENN